MSISFDFYLDDGTQVASPVQFSPPDGVDQFRVWDHHDRRDNDSWYRIASPWAFAPRYKVAATIRLTTNASIAKARDIVEMVRRGHDWAFALDHSERETATTSAAIAAGDSALTVGGALAVGKYYRIRDDGGYFDTTAPASDTLEEAWPGFCQSHVFKVTADNGSFNYTVTPVFQVPFLAGAYVSSQHYYTSCLLTDSIFEESYDRARFGWLWHLTFIEQFPAPMANPSW